MYSSMDRTSAAARRPRGLATRLVLTALAIAAALPSAARAQDWHTITDTRQRAGETALDVEIEYGAGALSVQPADPGMLYHAQLRYDARTFDPRVEYDADDGELRVGVEGGRGIDMDVEDGGRLDLGLGRDVPIDLDLAFGAVAADIEFGGMRLRSLEIATGASDTELRFSEPNPERLGSVQFSVGAANFRATSLGNANAASIQVEGGVGDVTLDFTGDWQRDMDVDIEMGLGSLTLQLPRGLGVRVVNDSFLASFDGQEMVKRGDSYYSENWDDADYRLTLNLDAVLSGIDVRWVDDSRVTAAAAAAPRTR